MSSRRITVPVVCALRVRQLKYHPGLEFHGAGAYSDEGRAGCKRARSATTSSEDRTTLRAGALTALLLLVLVVLSAAQVPPELRKSMRARLEAVWKKDAVTWSRRTADEFRVVVPDGRFGT
jgi:hypothetical protein